MTVSTYAKWPLAAALLVLAAGCSKQDDSTGQAPATTPPPTAAPAQKAPDEIPAEAQAAISAAIQLNQMDAEQLRSAAIKALGENRLYAPASNNAFEYYLALREKAPDDPAVASALTDLMPYTVIAVEQSIGRQDFPEARRLETLIAKADPKAPALPRLVKAIETGEKSAEAKVASDEAKAKADADTRTREQQRLAEQAVQQKAAADQQAAQQAAEAQRQEAARVAAAQKAAADKAVADKAAAEKAAAAPVAAAATAAKELRLMSAPAPRFPPDALRAGTKGEVMVEITVAPDGSVSNARVVRAEPLRVFDREALNAVRRWKFEPTGTVMTTRRTIVFNPGG